ncbi:GTPase IMAP family member 8-like [Engraulis encrasicolus]|uniref:GTPase IMAP family member 8-like n=1 Tax=Engraulis encrasicolus TaxID=184585 RepID=UPI002FD2767D
MEEIICGNGGRHYEMDMKRQEEVTKRKERATARMMKVEEQRQHLQSLKGQLGLLPQLQFRIVLLGTRLSGKSSSGNTILGREAFDLKRTTQCVTRQGEVAGRQLTVVEAPGWWRFCDLQTKPELTKQEIVLSVSLCPPGPHIFLLHVHIADPSSSQYIENTLEHVTYLGEEVWSHTMVLFSRGDWLGEKPIEQYIESEEALQSLVEKCGNRYHVLNNMDKGDREQITELLEKMEEIICGNGGRHYEMDMKRQEEVMKRKERATARMMKMEEIICGNGGRHYEMDRKRLEEVMKRKEGATARVMKVEKQRQHLQSLKGQLLPQLEFRIVLLGYTLSGKGSSGNTILGREAFDLKRTTQCVTRQGEVAGRQLTVVEAPGWWVNVNLKNTAELPKQENMLSVSLCPPGPHIFLLHVRLGSAVIQADIDSMLEHVNLLTERVWSHTMLLFTHGDWLGDTPIELIIESEVALQFLVEKCGNRYHVLNNMERDDCQVLELLEKIEDLVAGNGGQHFEIDNNKVLAIQKKRRHLIKRAEDREESIHKQRDVIQFVMGAGLPLPQVRILSLQYMEELLFSDPNGEMLSDGVTLQSETKHCSIEDQDITTVLVKMSQSANTLQETKDAFVSTLSLCDPGPHAIFLVVEMSLHFSEENRRRRQIHLELLGENVWDHVIVVFVSKEYHLAYKLYERIEEYIEMEGEALQWLVEKCGGRYICRKDKSMSDELKRIGEMMLVNGGRYFRYEEGRTNQTTAATADWRREQMLELKKKEDELAQRRRTSLQLESEDVNQGTYDTHISDKAVEEGSVLSVARSIIEPPRMGGDDFSFYSLHISDTASEAPSEQDTGISVAKSMNIPPMSMSRTVGINICKDTV